MRLEELLRGNDFYQYLGLRSQEVAALLGVSPQTISSYSVDDMIKDNRLEKLYKALFFVGGDRYLMAAEKVFSLAAQLGIFIEYSTIENRVEPHQLYSSKELWFFSDNPMSIINQEVFFNSIFSRSVKSSYQESIVSFFFRTIDGATRFAEELERKAFSPLIQDSRITNEKGLIYNNYTYLIVLNIFPFGEDFVISNPGSICARSSGVPSSFFYDGKSYVRTTTSPTMIIDEIRRLDIGTRYQPENFFPLGVKLTKDIFYHESVFTDPLIAIKGDHIAGGIIDYRNQISSKYEEKDKAINSSFSDKAGFIPIAILALKKIPGSSFSTHNNKIQRQIKSELQADHQNDHDYNSSFW